MQVYDDSDSIMLHDIVEVVGVVSHMPELAAWHMEAQAQMDAAAGVCVCVCVCVCRWSFCADACNHLQLTIRCMCVCVCVCTRMFYLNIMLRALHRIHRHVLLRWEGGGWLLRRGLLVPGPGGCRPPHDGGYAAGAARSTPPHQPGTRMPLFAALLCAALAAHPPPARYTHAPLRFPYASWLLCYVPHIPLFV